MGTWTDGRTFAHTHALKKVGAEVDTLLGTRLDGRLGSFDQSTGEGGVALTLASFPEAQVRLVVG